MFTLDLAFPRVTVATILACICTIILPSSLLLSFILLLMIETNCTNGLSHSASNTPLEPRTLRNFALEATPQITGKHHSSHASAAVSTEASCISMLTCDSSCRCTSGVVAASHASTTLDLILMVIPRLKHAKSAGYRMSASAAHLHRWEPLSTICSCNLHRSARLKSKMLHHQQCTSNS